MHHPVTTGSFRHIALIICVKIAGHAVAFARSDHLFCRHYRPHIVAPITQRGPGVVAPHDPAPFLLAGGDASRQV